MSRQKPFIPPDSFTEESEALYRSGLRNTFKARLGDTEAASIVFIFDEARALLSADLRKLTNQCNFVALRRAFTYLPSNKKFRTPLAIVTDTTAKICNLAPTKALEPSFRVSKLTSAIFPPFYLLANVDVWFENEPTNLKNLHQHQYYCQFGRPHWGALAKQIEGAIGFRIQDLMELARVKIMGSERDIFFKE